MEYLNCIFWVALMLLAVTRLSSELETTTPLDLTPIVSKSRFTSCTTKSGHEGQCVHESYCNMKFMIETGGVIEDSELRSVNCINEVEWCCTEKNVTLPPLPKPGEKVYVNAKSCTTNADQPGICVHESYCYNKNMIEHGGIIADSELRSIECPDSTQVCCSEINTNQAHSPRLAQEYNCKVSKRPDCPWCVNLYRDGNHRHQVPSGFYCMGTMISYKVILTTGTCMIQAQRNNVWARIPSSADPNANYTVKFRQIHPNYNSGTRENDLALFVVDRNVEWQTHGPQGACIGIEEALEGDCIGAGVDDDENYDFTPLSVTKGNCGRGASSDASCGRVYDEQDCTVVSGAPVMCRVKGSFMVVGLTKVPCFDNPKKNLLGHLNQASSWLNKQLKGTMGLSEQEYLKL